MNWLTARLLVAACAIARIAMAEQRTDDLIAQGAADLSHQRYSDALKKFDAAAQADPSNVEAVFFQGATLNRLGRHAPALERLQRATTMGFQHPDVPFETAWSLLGVQRWREAIEQLERFERAQPGRGQASEFLGRAYLGLRELNKAEAAFNEAIRRDPDLKPTVRLYMALLEERRQNTPASREQLRALLEEAPQTPTGRAIRDEIQRRVGAPTTAQGGEKPWHVTVTVGGGYNSNVISLGDSQPLPSDISHKDAGFGAFGLEASYDWRLSDEDSLTAGYGFQSVIYDGLSESDLIDHTWSVDWRHVFGKDFASALRLSDEFTQIGGNAFRNQFLVRPATAYRWAPWTITELAYAFAVGDYYFPTPAAQDRDGFTHTLSLVQYFYPTGTKLQARAGYFHGWNRSDGTDADSDADGFLIGVRHPLCWKIAADVSYTRSYDHAEHANSLPTSSGSFVKRRTEADAVGVQLSRPITDWLSTYAGYSFNRASGNISFYKYHQHVYSAGVVMRF